MKTTQQSGYVLVLTLMIASILVLIVSAFFNRSTIQVFFDKSALDREQAKSLAMSGIALTYSMLNIEKAEKEPGKKEESPQKLFLKKVLPILNQWQTITLTQEADGLDGTIKIYIACEDGKVNINQLFDFKQHKFFNEGKEAQDAKKFFQELFNLIKPFIGGKDLFPSFETALKQRQSPLIDPTELLTIKEFQTAFKTTQFPQPIDTKKVVFLCDIFTTTSRGKTIQPWFFSQGLQALLGIQRATLDKQKKSIDTITENFAGYTGSVEQAWTTFLAPWYNKDYKALPATFKGFLQNSFEPRIFSVCCHATYGEITQRIFAIIEKQEKMAENSSPFIVKKIYWI